MDTHAYTHTHTHALTHVHTHTTQERSREQKLWQKKADNDARKITNMLREDQEVHIWMHVTRVFNI